MANQLYFRIFLGGTVFGLAIFIDKNRDSISEKEAAILVATVMVTILVAGFVHVIARRNKNRETLFQRQVRDISKDVPIPPEAAKPYINELRKQGFERLGETIIELPDKQRFISWHMCDRSRTTAAGVMFIKYPECRLKTLFNDGTMLETSYLIGEAIRIDSKFYGYTNPLSIADTYEEHRQHLKELIPEHGQPRIFLDMSVVMDWEQLYRPLYDEKLGQVTAEQNKNDKTALGMFLVIIIILAIWVLLLNVLAGNV